MDGPVWLGAAQELRALTRVAHITLGFFVLILFWLQIFSRKGSGAHVLVGKLYYWLGLGVVGLAAFGVVVLLAPSMLRPGGPPLADAGFAAMAFLGYLSVVTFVVLEKGRSAIRFHGPSPGARAVFAWARAGLAIAASLFLVGYAIIAAPPNAILLLALSPIGVFAGIETAAFQLRGNSPYKERWVLEHLDGMIGSGIAFHTAFFVFGAGRFVDTLGADSAWRLAPWLAPVAIGLPATSLWKRHVMRTASSADR